MTRKRKIQIHIAAAFVVVCLVGWIVLIYAEKHQEKEDWENEFLMRYSAVLSDATWHLGQFEEMKSFEDQKACLEIITNDLMQLKAYMEMHINLAGISMPEAIKAPEINTSGWYEVETVIGIINNGGTIDSYSIESFWTDGAISEEEKGVIWFLKEEMEKLWRDMHLLNEDGVNDQYVLSSLEIYQRVTEMMQQVKHQMIIMRLEQG